MSLVASANASTSVLDLARSEMAFPTADIVVITRSAASLRVAAVALGIASFANNADVRLPFS
jgi:hypothetical protein